MLRLFLLVIFCSTTFLFSQQVSGTVTDEDQNPIPAVVVINMKTEQKVYTNLTGEFKINALPTEELWFIRQGFERSSKIVMYLDFSYPIYMIIIRSILEIEEVKLPAVRLTGDLNRDSRN